MRQAIELNLTDGWEGIVNSAERHNARVRFEQKLHARELLKLRRMIVALSLGALLVVALGAAGLLASWVADTAAVLMICGACLVTGSLLERRRQV